MLPRMSKPYSIYPRVAVLIALCCSVTPLSLLVIEKFSGHLWFLDGCIIGSVFTSTILAAAWTAFGPGRLRVRLPLSLLWGALMGLSIDIVVQMVDGPRQLGYFTLMTSVLWLIAQLPYWGMSLGFGLKLWHHTTAIGSTNLRQRQFGIRQLMIFTACIAVLLGVGRWLVLNVPKTMFDSNELKFWGFLFVSQIATSIPLICATMLPRYVPAGLLASLLLITGLAAAQIPLARQLLVGIGPPGGDYWLLIAVSLSGTLWILLFAAVVRYSGYHFGVPVVEQGAIEK